MSHLKIAALVLMVAVPVVAHAAPMTKQECETTVNPYGGEHGQWTYVEGWGYGCILSWIKGGALVAATNRTSYQYHDGKLGERIGDKPVMANPDLHDKGVAMQADVKHPVPPIKKPHPQPGE